MTIAALKDEVVLDGIDKEILNRIQGDFPVSVDPYGDIGTGVGLSAEATLERVRALKERGILRKIGPFFDARKMGYRSTLCAVDVPQEKLHEAAKVISSFVEVTHNYLREGSPNVWFTVIAESKEAIEGILSEISRKAGVGPIRNLPAERMFKVKVDLKITE